MINLPTNDVYCNVALDSDFINSYKIFSVIFRSHRIKIVTGVYLKLDSVAFGEARNKFNNEPHFLLYTEEQINVYYF